MNNVPQYCVHTLPGIPKKVNGIIKTFEIWKCVIYFYNFYPKLLFLISINTKVQKEMIYSFIKL
jgi:hypothetical protein